jgi:hypothetical protein
MESNSEIRQRMDTYRTILLVINWIASGIGVIAGFIMMGTIGGFGFLIVIIAIIIGVIGHFLINVTLAIPFILLNNGDTLESIKKNIVNDASSTNSSVENKNCPFCAEKIKDKAKICPYCNKNIEEYENERKAKEEEEKKHKEKEMKEKFKNIEDFFNDEEIIKQAKEMRRLYGKGMYISHLKNKAKELGLGEIDINENDIE